MNRYISIELAVLALIGLSQIMYGQSLATNKAKRMTSTELLSGKFEPSRLADADSSYEGSIDEAKQSDDIMDELFESKREL